MRQENEVLTLALQRAWEHGRNGMALAPDMASAVVDDLRDAGFEIVPTPDDDPLPEPDEICLSVGYGETPLPYMSEGSAARVGEARRTGDWSGVSDADWKAWVSVLRTDADRRMEVRPITEEDVARLRDAHGIHVQAGEARSLARERRQAVPIEIQMEGQSMRLYASPSTVMGLSAMLSAVCEVYDWGAC